MVAAALGLPLRLLLVAGYAYLLTEIGSENAVWDAVLAAAIGEAVGGTILFWAVHWLLREAVVRVNPSRVGAIDNVFGGEAPFVLIALRFVPGLPFLLANLMIGLSPIRSLMYVIVSTAALIPVYWIYASSGAEVTSLETLLLRDLGESIESPMLWWGLAIAGMTPLVLRLMFNRNVRKGFRQLKDLADDSDSPTLDDAKADIQALDEAANERRLARRTRSRV
jgi:uncharacterized membrane protein YdjX (TVP38/TMEM64 family)